MISYILISLLVFSIIVLGAYFFAINLLYKRNEKKNINIKNVFPFEAAPKYKTDFFFVNILLILSVATIVTSNAIFVSLHHGVIVIFILVISVLLAFCLIAAPLLSLKTLKEHLYIDIAMMVLFFALNGFLTYFSYSICKLYDYKNVTAIIAMVISAILLLFSLLFVFNPRIFDLRMNEDNTRPKVIPLALSEWLIIFTSPLSIIPLILLASIL